MTIVVQCPHCETKFNLQPELTGKTMRCPNLDCRQVFTVREQPRPVDPPPALPLEALPLPDEPDTSPIPAKPGSRTAGSTKKKKTENPRGRGTPNKPSVVDAQIVEGQVVEAAIVAPPKVKEVVWSEGTNVPPPKGGGGGKRSQPIPLDEENDRPIRRRKKKKNWGPIILIGMVITLFMLAGATGLYLLQFSDRSEKQAADKADKEYSKGEYATAAKSFEKLATDYPDNDNTPRYKFFAELSALQVVVRSVTNREDPNGATDKLVAFIKSHKDSPFAKHTSGYGRDILEAGKKLEDDIVDHAKDRVKAYTEDRSNKANELERADKAIASGRALLPLIEPFRAPDDPPLDSVSGKLDQAEAEVKHERDRTAALTKAERQLENLSYATIQIVENDLATAGFLSDPDAQAKIAAAKGKLQALVRYEVDPLAPIELPPPVTSTLLFVAPIGKPRPPSAASGGDNSQTVFLAVARGILYAIEEGTGEMKWAVRVGQEITDPPTIARVELPDGPTDVAVVTSHVGGQSAIATYTLRNGQARWYQQLPAIAAGPAVVVGNRAFVPIRDSLGTIYDFDLVTGERKGHIRLAQPIGPGAIVRPGTGLLYVPADAHRIYVIDVLIRDDEGNLKPPQCVQVIATGHPAGTLRTLPVMLGPDGDMPAERWMILSQADGPSSMKIRAFQVLPIPTPTPDGRPATETAGNLAAELPLQGWAWFPPATDGERLAVATDAGQMRLFEVKQTGNSDKVLFPLPEPQLPKQPEANPVRSIVFPAEEAAFWVLTNGTLQKYRLGLVASAGMKMLQVGPAISLGEVTQSPQYNNRKDAVCLVVRSLNSDGCKAVLMGLRDGSFRWQRQLGVVPATAPIPQGNGLLLVAKDGGLLLVPDSTVATPGSVKAAPPEWVIAPPPENVTSPTVVAVSADGKTVYTVTQALVVEDLKLLSKYLIRRVVGGKLVHEGSVNAPALSNGAPAPLAGPPVIFGDSLLLPVANGFIYRHVAGSAQGNGGKSNPDTLTAGPQWSGEQRSDAAIKCYITPLSDSAFLTSDGTKKLSRWDWPADGNWNAAGGWVLREQPAGPGLMLPSVGGEPARLLIQDVSGSVWLYPNDRGGQHLKRWRAASGITSGRPSSPLVMQLDSTGKPVVAYTVEDKVLVCLDPTLDQPRLAVRSGEEIEGTLVGAPQPSGAGRWTITDLGGKVTLYETTSEKPAASAVIGLAGAVPAAASTPLNGSSVLTPLLDGSAVVLPLPVAPTNNPEAKPKE